MFLHQQIPIPTNFTGARATYPFDEDERKASYDYIYRESERLSRLINNVLQFAGLNRGEREFNGKEQSLEEALKSIEAAIRPQIECSNFSYEQQIASNIEEGSAMLMVDSDSLVQIIVNLVDNALKFSAEVDEKTISFACSLENIDGVENICFSVRDFGPGVDPAFQEKIFEVFYRGENELNRATPGTGIGLALVQELASQMGARVTFENKSPGVEFKVLFPETQVVN